MRQKYTIVPLTYLVAIVILGVTIVPLLVFTTTSHFTLPLGVATYQSQYSQNTGAILAFTALAAVPALGVFMFAERYLVAGAAGAVKG